MNEERPAGMVAGRPLLRLRFCLVMNCFSVVKTYSSLSTYWGIWLAWANIETPAWTRVWSWVNMTI